MSEPSTSKLAPIKFGDVVIEREDFSVSRKGKPCSLTPRAFDVLTYLIENRGRVVEKHEIFDAVWKDTFVTDNALMRAVGEIRRELGDSATEPQYIETVHKRGYRFIAEIETAPTEPSTVFNIFAASDRSISLPPHDSREKPELTGRGSLPSSRAIAVVLVFIAVAAAAFVYFARGELPIRSIAIIPLENSGTGEDTEYVSDGIAESIINSLSAMPDLKVAARATAFRYRGQEFDPQKIGRELGVDAIMTGRVVQTGDDLTVQADLIDAADGSQIWGARYTRKLSAVYELPGAIAADLAKKLDLKLTSDQEKRLTKNYTENPEAYRLYLLGRFFWNKRSEEALNTSIDYFRQSIENDPSYALAYAGLADSYAVMAISADLPAHEVFPKAKAAAAKALELDDELVEAHATMLRIRSQYEWNWAEAEREYRRALELNPNYPMTHIYYLSYLVSAGRVEEAVASVQRARELDPLSLVANAVAARAMFFAGRYDDAIEASRKTLELDQNVFLARLILGRSYARKGMYDEAIAELEKARALPGSVSEATSLLAYTFAVSGRTDDARRLLGEMMQLSASRYVQPYDLAIVHAGLGDKDAAFEWLEKAYQHRNHQVPLINSVPEFESIRSDLRFAELVQRIQAAR
ncbi:MAG TPA: winged helix-turn-helix domain-containing protein [Pyrinomonadaceae bacterium]|nr:winged helix-turn-helix domain-containing protein [Pyrinomonadaceae bacterium]